MEFLTKYIYVTIRKTIKSHTYCLILLFNLSCLSPKDIDISTTEVISSLRPQYVQIFSSSRPQYVRISFPLISLYDCLSRNRWLYLYIHYLYFHNMESIWESSIIM